MAIGIAILGAGLPIASLGATDPPDYCALFTPSTPEGDPPLAGGPRLDSIAQACTELQINSVNTLPIQSLLRPIREEASFLELVRRRAREMAELSKQEANYIEYCFASRPNPENHIFEWASRERSVADSIRQFCEQLRPKIQEQASQLPEYRRRLALMNGQTEGVLLGIESDRLPSNQKVNPQITPYYYDFSLRQLVTRTLPPLSDQRGPNNAPSELDLAAAEYDATFRRNRQEINASLEASFRETGIRFPDSYRYQIKERMAAWRQAQGRLARGMLAQNPLLAHFRSAAVTNDSIAEAAANVRRRADETIRRLDVMEREIPRREDGAYDLMLIEGAVSDVLSETPGLCQIANRAHSHYKRVTAIKELQLFAGAFVLGSACFFVIRHPGPCMMTTFTGAAAYNFGWEVLPRHSFRLAAFESALSQDRSIVRLLNELDDSERQTFIAGLLIIVPWEAGAALPYHVAYHHLPRFAAIVDRISARAQMPARQLLERIRSYSRPRSNPRQHSPLSSPDE